MDKRIPLSLESAPEIAIDGELVARALGLDTAAFRQLMDDRKIAVLCERGTGEDAGLYRATFYFDGRRARLVVDGEGQPVGPIEA
jgi:hypothetical protein